MNVRLLGPTVSKTINVNGRIYTGAPGAVIDANEADAQILGTAGWVWVCRSGPTSARPVPRGEPAIAATATMQYCDTTVGAMLVFDYKNWRSVVDGSLA